MDEAVQTIVQLQEEQQLAAQTAAAKNTVISQTRKDRSPAQAGEPTGAMLDNSLYFNWRGQGRCHRAPVDMDYCVELLYSCLSLDNELRKLMSGAILSELYGAFMIMMASQGLVSIPG